MINFTYIADIAEKPEKNWSNRQIAQFHYFNKNGLVAQKDALDKKISQLVADGIVPSGWIMAYGSFNSSNRDSIAEMARKKRVSPIELRVALEMLEEDIARINQKIEELNVPAYTRIATD